MANLLYVIFEVLFFILSIGGSDVDNSKSKPNVLVAVILVATILSIGVTIYVNNPKPEPVKTVALLEV